MYAVSILAVISALFVWRRERRFTGLPREHFVSAMRAGMRFVRNTSAIQAAMVRTACYSIPASAPWALLPLYVRRDLMLGPGMYGVILGMMGIGGVTSGMLLPIVRGKLSRGGTVVGCTLLSCAGMAVVGISNHWIPAALGMLLFGLGWTSAFATIQAAAQLVCPPWVRARALSIYQLAQNGALTLGSFGWGWLGGQIGIPHTFLTATGRWPGADGASPGSSASRPLCVPPSAVDEQGAPLPEAPAPEFVPVLRTHAGTDHGDRLLPCRTPAADRIPEADERTSSRSGPGRGGVLAGVRGCCPSRGLGRGLVDGKLDRSSAGGDPPIGR